MTTTLKRALATVDTLACLYRLDEIGSGLTGVPADPLPLRDALCVALDAGAQAEQLDSILRFHSLIGPAA